MDDQAPHSLENVTAPYAGHRWMVDELPRRAAPRDDDVFFRTPTSRSHPRTDARTTATVRRVRVG